MSLSAYNKKRSFEKSPEPKGTKRSSGKKLHFVVQEHDASHLHFDFRLEMEGVLKSWAVPKGPSLDPSVKRLAMMVEDHPFDYRNFEGTIPDGNYGAGTVMIWDEGWYEPDTEQDPAAGGSPGNQEKSLLKQLKSGRIKFILHGKKLNGSFALIKTKGQADNAWLLIKHRDKYASVSDITKKSKSVKSGRTMNQIARAKDPMPLPEAKAAIKNGGAAAKKLHNASQAAVSAKGMAPSASSRKGRKSPMPQNLRPMLATRVETAFDDPGWIYEIKWDGYRALSYLFNSIVEIRSRNNLSFNNKFKPIVEALREWKVNAIIDGEIIAVDEKGHADFQALQNFEKKAAKAVLQYQVFDLIWLDGLDLSSLPLLDRKEKLLSIMPPHHKIIHYSDHIQTQGKAFFQAAIKKGLEGVMAKKADSEYVTGFRSRNWLKIKNDQNLEAVICGFTKPRNNRKFFGAIVLGKYYGSTLRYIGHSGSGFDEDSLKDLFEVFKPLIVKKCPFPQIPETNMPVTWIRPELVCEIKFTEWTDEKLLRHPIFLGLKEDKRAKAEKNEIVIAPSEIKKSHDSSQKYKINKKNSR